MPSEQVAKLTNLAVSSEPRLFLTVSLPLKQFECAQGRAKFDRPAAILEAVEAFFERQAEIASETMPLEDRFTETERLPVTAS